MNTLVDKAPSHKNQSVAHAVASRHGTPEPVFQWSDQRPAAVAQKNIQEMANNSPRIKRLNAIQEMANHYVETQQTTVPQQQAVQKKEDGEEVVQRTPAEWAAAPQITRILQHAHGWFSTWKQIKAEMNHYMALAPIALDARKDCLDTISQLIAEWQANPDHTAASTEQRIHDILADLPILNNLIDREYKQIEDKIVENYYATGHIVHPNIPDELSAGIAVLPNNALKAQQIFNNVNSFRFRYTGLFLTPRVAFTAHQGDCQTLVGLYERVALHHHIPFAVGNQVGRQLVAPRPIHGRNSIANTEGNTDWYFQEHYWAIGNHTPYDVLFMVSPPPVSVLSNGSAVYQGVTYYTFNDGRCVIDPNQAALQYEIMGEGRVFANVAATRAFIDAHQ